VGVGSGNGTVIFRICGLFGEEAEITKIVESSPLLQFMEAGSSAAGDVVRYRREIELAEADDILFCSWDASRFSRTQSAFRRIMR
jgi:hypothetical protein